MWKRQKNATEFTTVIELTRCARTEIRNCVCACMCIYNYTTVWTICFSSKYTYILYSRKYRYILYFKIQCLCLHNNNNNIIIKT